MSMTTIENFKCVFCSEVFNDKELLQEHFRKHGDPDFNKNAKNKGKLQNEVPSSTEKTEESELVSCDVCEEVFPTISKAITHKHKVHPDHDAKYFCPWCGKLFTMKHLYNKHLQSSHNGVTNVDVKDFHCDSCSVYFFIPSAMLHHNKFFHRQDIDLNSLGSSKKVKLFNQELVAILYCPFCGEEYNNKVNLHKHMEDDHGDENQSPEEVLRCPLCEAYFHHLDAYELHLTFHSTEDLYNEPNEMVSEITEFSLEAVPPLMEKVQDANLESVNNFLELLESESVETGRVKSKKHKKHKKSKKESITLDEFLNMNKDVFGDGLNVQGIEEVPTQMVLKRKYKTKKPSNNVDVKMIKQDLAKLKKQGIVIKTKSSKVPSNLVQNLKSNNISQASLDPDDVISKLMGQGNSEIKISKTSIQKDAEIKQESYQSNKIDSSSDYDTNKFSQPYVEENKDLIQHKEEDVSNPVTAEDINEKINPTDEDYEVLANGIVENNVDNTGDCDRDNETENATVNTISEESPFKTLQYINTALTIKTLSQKQNEIKNVGNIDTNTTENEAVMNISEESPFKNIQNIGAALTMKSVPQINNIQDVDNIDTNKVESRTVTTVSEESPFKTIRNISAALTIKSISQTNNKINHVDNIDSYKSENETVMKIAEDSPFKAIQNISAALTKKSVPHTNNKINDVDSIDRDNGNNEQSFEDDPNDANEDTNEIETEENNLKNNTLQSLNLKTDITVKPIVKNNISNTSSDHDNQDNSDKNIQKNKSINALKGLSNQITVKPSISSPASNIHHSSNVGEKTRLDKTDNGDGKNFSAQNQCNQKLLQPKTGTQSGLEHTEADNSEYVQSNADILRRLTNVTAKPVSPKIVQTNKAIKTIPKKEAFKSTVENDVEILHIDDSDSDADTDHALKYNLTKPSQSTMFKKSQVVKPSTALSGLSKNITVKSMSQQSMKSTESLSKDGKREFKKTILSRTFESKNINTIKNNDKLLEEQKKLQKTINHLRRHITIKPKNNPQLIYTEEPPQNDEDIDNMDSFEDEDYNSDTSGGNIKITELNEDEINDAEHQVSIDNMDDERNISVESPKDDANFKQDDFDDFDDIETQIKADPIKTINNQTKPPSQQPIPSNLSNLHKELTIKPVRQKQLSEDEIEPYCDNTRNGKSMAVRLTNKRQQINNNVAQSSQKASSSTNQVNTVKTVKTYQSKTVIEEITTTVTKTIRTVNTQEVKNTNQVVSRPVQSQKIMNKNTNPIQGTFIRQASPIIGTKVRNATPHTSPNTSKPSNMICPSRPKFNRPQMPSPCRKPTPTVQKSPQSSFISNNPTKATQPALKTIKRPSKETGHFSCFKKPKESLIPVKDIPNIKDEDGLVQYSSSQNKSTFSNITKVVQGNSSGTTSQVRSETSMSSEQQFAKLSGVSGLKIVKTSTKQATQVEEKCEVNAPKNNTIAALEKLQKQGLLIKKPRFDTYVNESHSQRENDEED